MRFVRTWAPSTVVAVAVAVALLVPREMASVVILGVTIAGPLFLALARTDGPTPAPQAVRVLGVMAAVPVVLMASALASANPYVGFVGRVQQHNGALLWAAWFLVAAALAIRPQAGDVRRIAMTVSLAASVLALGALADAGGIEFGRQFSNESSGFLTSSQTLGQALAVGLAASIAWALMPRKGQRPPVAAVVAALICVTALMTSGARAATMAAIAAAVIAGLLSAFGRERAGARGFALAAVGAIAVVAAAGSVAAAMSTAPWWADANARLSGRLTLWRAAMESFVRSPLIGKGPDQFQAVISWVMPAGAPSPQVVSAADAHNLVLTMAATAGAVGLAAFFVALAAGAYGVFLAIARSRFSPSVLALAGGLTAWVLAAQFAWVGELGGLFAAVVFGGLLGAGTKAEGHAPGRIAPALVVAAVSATMLLGAVVFAGHGLVTEARWFSPNSPQDLRSSALIAIESPDPTMAEGVAQDILAGAIAQRDPRTQGAIESLLGHVVEDRGWSVGTAAAFIDHEYLKAVLGGDSDLGNAIDRAAEADPSTGLWPFMGAAHASRLGATDDAGRYARQAMNHPLGPAERQWLNDNIKAAEPEETP